MGPSHPARASPGLATGSQSVQLPPGGGDSHPLWCQETRHSFAMTPAQRLQRVCWAEASSGPGRRGDCAQGHSGGWQNSFPRGEKPEDPRLLQAVSWRQPTVHGPRGFPHQPERGGLQSERDGRMESHVTYNAVTEVTPRHFWLAASHTPCSHSGGGGYAGWGQQRLEPWDPPGVCRPPCPPPLVQVKSPLPQHVPAISRDSLLPLSPVAHLRSGVWGS